MNTFSIVFFFVAPLVLAALVAGVVWVLRLWND